MSFAKIGIRNSESFSPYVKEIGETALAWNGIQLVVFYFFVGFSCIRAKNAAKAFYTLKSDSTQRDMTKNLGISILSANPNVEVSSKVIVYKDIMDRIRNKSGERN